MEAWIQVDLEGSKHALRRFGGSTAVGCFQDGRLEPWDQELVGGLELDHPDGELYLTVRHGSSVDRAELNVPVGCEGIYNHWIKNAWLQKCELVIRKL